MTFSNVCYNLGYNCSGTHPGSPLRGNLRNYTVSSDNYYNRYFVGNPETRNSPDDGNFQNSLDNQYNCYFASYCSNRYNS